MKRFGRGFLVYTTTGAVCLAVSFTPSPAKGSKLLDLLRKKEVITEEEYRELKAVEEAERARIEERIKKSQSPFDITYKDGFGVTSKDKTVELRVRVQLFNQFSVFPADSGADDNFFLRRARITFQGWVFRDFTYRLDLEGASSPLVRTTYLGWEKYKQFRIQVGQSITRFGGEEVWSRYSLFFLERSMISDNLTEGPSRGVYIYSDPVTGVPVQLQFSVTNGVGSVDDNNNSKDFALRVIGQPFKGTPWANILPIEMAGNFAIGEQPLDANGAQTRLFLQDNRLVVFEATTRGLRQRYGGDIWYNKDYKNNGALPIPVSAMFEFIYESQERDGPTLGWLPDVIRYGYVLQGGAMLMGSRSKNGLELVAKVEGIDMDDDANNGGAGDLVGQTVTTYGFGLNYWPIKEVRLTIDGFIFNFGRPVGSPTSPDPFLNGDTAWAILMGAYFKF